MVARRSFIDVSDLPELRRVAEEARERQEPIVLRAGDEEIAVVEPIVSPGTRSTGVLTQEQFDAAMSAAGSWAGLIDVDEFIEEIYASRGSTRPPVDL